jgi:hypothetical protein
MLACLFLVVVTAATASELTAPPSPPSPPSVPTHANFVLALVDTVGVTGVVILFGGLLCIITTPCCIYCCVKNCSPFDVPGQTNRRRSVFAMANSPWFRRQTVRALSVLGIKEADTVPRSQGQQPAPPPEDDYEPPEELLDEDDVPDGWEQLVDDQGDVYYHNPQTGETSWDLPGGGDVESHGKPQPPLAPPVIPSGLAPPPITNAPLAPPAIPSGLAPPPIMNAPPPVSYM